MSKRGAQGGGSIRQRKDGTWEGRYTLGRDPGTGEQVQKSIYGKTQREVRMKLQQVTAQIDVGEYLEPVRFTTGEWLDTWVVDFLGDVKLTTRISYEQHVKNHLKPALGAVKLRALSAPVIQRFINDLQKGEKPLKAKTIKNVYGVLHRALAQAVELGFLRSNPSDACKLPRVEKFEIMPLDTDEIEAFLAAIRKHPLRTLLTFDLFSGLRVGELTGLGWPSVDFTQGTITVERQLQRPRRKGDVFYMSTLKNDNVRVLHPAPFVMQLLKEHRRRQNEQRLHVGDLWDDFGFPNLVFTTNTGRFINYSTLRLAYKQVLKRAGIAERRLHDLRDSYAVTSIRAGDDIKTVQGNMGHATAAFTLDAYARVTEMMKKESSARMEAYIASLKMD